MLGVAPFTGSVDWNSQSGSAFLLFQVAPFTGSVDWNRPIPPGNHNVLWSLPSRGAWIEIISIDDSISDNTSLPSRGAWIEMQYLLRTAVFYMVAPFTGSVDWNCNESHQRRGVRRRSLHGERGLKFIGKKENLRECLSLPSRGAWIEILSHTASDRAVCVAPFTGSVDWNSFTQLTQPYSFQVAPFTGSVDWNRQTNWVSLWHILSLPSRGWGV